jgi:hypothetical protein
VKVAVLAVAVAVALVSDAPQPAKRLERIKSRARNFFMG